jgi:hypothetical protein
MDWLLITLAISATALMVWIDKIRFGTFFTPATILAVPYMGIAMLAFVAGPALGYVPLYTPSLIVWTCYVTLFWGTGQIATGFLPRAALLASPLPDERPARPLALTAAWLIIPLLAYATWAAGNSLGGLQDFRGDEYREATLQGWAGHVLVFSYPIFIYLVAAVRRKNAALCGVSAGLLLILMVLRPTKSWVLLPLVAGLIYRARMGRFRLSLWKIVAVILLAYCLFTVSYLIAFGAADPRNLTDSEVYGNLLRHVGDYLFSGVLAFSAHMQNGGTHLSNPPAAYAPFINLAATITGYPLVSPIVDEFTVIRSGTDGFRANVHTLFGTLIMSVGYLETAFYTCALSLITYASFLASRRSSDAWITALWCFVGAGLAFAWFDTYFSQLALLEVPVVCLVLSAFGRALARHPSRGALLRCTQGEYEP